MLMAITAMATSSRLTMVVKTTMPTGQMDGGHDVDD
jgi:hypothetical protein